jgi:nucleotide-binding universal stress UspA family protein
MLNHILVPLDESEFAEKALSYAEQILAPKGQLTLLTVVDTVSAVYPLMPGPYPVPIEQSLDAQETIRVQLSQRADSYLNSVVERLSTSDFRVVVLVREGIPAETIVSAAEELAVDAIAMSTHGRSGLGRWIFGSVTQKVLSATPCPVFIIPNR